MNRQPNFSTLSAYLAEKIPLKDLSPQQAVKNSIFITARYRTGSTYLYSLFSSLANTATFYEPLNYHLVDNLDKDEQQTQQDKSQFAHTLKEGYLADYQSLDRNNLIKYFRREFNLTNIVMSATEQNDELKEYIHFLLSTYPQKLKVLQFNRIDFRLPWFKINFPQTFIVNLRRNPRDIYASFVGMFLRKTSEKPQVNLEEGVETMIDYVGLNEELDALSTVFALQSITDRLNSYQKVYLLNQLSNRWADSFADLVVEYESLIEDPMAAIDEILSYLPTWELSFDREFIEAKKNRINVWQEYHADSWFKNNEIVCNELIEQLFSKSA
ncbi:MAG: sulfotransferase [Cyanobacteriota bacterium]|nr:sulfotransferase [Cyanobacteriota bacterium]